LVMDIISFNNARLNDPSANYRFHVRKYFGFKIINIIGTETTDKDKTVRKICVNGASYKTGNTTNMSAHLRRKRGIIWSSSRHGETAKAQMNLPISVTKTGQLRVTLCLRKVHYLSTPLKHRELQKQWQDLLQKTCGLVLLNKTIHFKYRHIWSICNITYILHMKCIVSKVIVSWAKFMIHLISWGGCIVTPLLQISILMFLFTVTSPDAQTVYIIDGMFIIANSSGTTVPNYTLVHPPCFHPTSPVRLHVMDEYFKSDDK